MRITRSFLTMAAAVALMDGVWAKELQQQRQQRETAILRQLSGEPPVPVDEEDPLEETPMETLVGPDKCVDAEELGIGGTTYVMATINGTSEDLLPACGESTAGNSTGTWYKIAGTGSGIQVQIVTSFEIMAAVFKGSCDALVCVDGTTGEEPPFTYGNLRFASDEGETYYVHVGGFEGVEGDYIVALGEGEVPANTDCSAAPMIEIGDSIAGTTEFAKVPEGVPPCSVTEIFFNISSNAVWYTMMGTGEVVQFSVFADYHASISIFAGESCDDLTCVNANYDSPIVGPRSAIAQPLDDGQMYYIAVYGFGQRSGNFTMESTTLDLPANDDCSSATPLELGVAVSSVSLAATADEGLPFCGEGSNESRPGIWYSIEGTGNTLRTELNDTFYLHYSVYTGGCDNLSCAGNRFFGMAPFVWDSVEGETYSIFVYGREFALSDTFNISVVEATRPENDLCENAIELLVGNVVEGTTYSSMSDDQPSCGDVELHGFGGVWYTFAGTGDTYVVGLSSGGVDGTNFFDTQLSVYSGSCGDVTCVGGSDQGAIFGAYENYIVVETVEGETYYAYVTGFEVGAGDFTIAVLEADTPENDSCDTAISLELGDTVQGSTQLASSSDDLEFEECGTTKGLDTSAPGIWYMFEGGGFPVQLSIDAQYDMQLTVFDGTCGILTCVDGTEGMETNYFEGQLILDAAEGTAYYILVHGYQGATGDFELIYETAIF